MTRSRRRRTVLYASLGVALVVAALIGVIASAQPSPDVGSNTPCEAEMPQLLAFVKHHASARDATVLTVVYDPTDVGALKTYLAARRAHWPAVDDPAASVPYGVTGLPTSFLVAPGGTVYAYVPGEVTASELDSWLRQGSAKGLGRAGA